MDCAMEYRYLLRFAAGIEGEPADVECRQLKSLWTAFCLHHDLTVDTGRYDSLLAGVYKELEDNGHDRSDRWEDEDGFENFMCQDLV